GSANLPFGIQTSVIFTARAGTPYAWTYNADVNGDGNSGNDLLYVPRDINDISLSVPTGSTAQAEWDRLNAFIVSEPCLRDQRGPARQADCRGRYAVPATLPSIRRISSTNPRWRIQLGGKYTF